MSRINLPTRRRSTTSQFRWRMQHLVTVTLGFHHDGELAEIFASCGKTGEDLEAVARDAMIITSIAMQFGAPLDTIVRALTRAENGDAASLAGAILDHVHQELRL